MSNYKEEVDRTERMAQRIMQNVTRITGELNRDSDINVSSLSGVYGAIRQAKDSRKRWAQGTGGFKFTSAWRPTLEFTPPPLSFTPSYTIIRVNGVYLLYQKNRMYWWSENKALPDDIVNNSDNNVIITWVKYYNNSAGWTDEPSDLMWIAYE